MLGFRISLVRIAGIEPGVCVQVLGVGSWDIYKCTGLGGGRSLVIFKKRKYSICDWNFIIRPAGLIIQTMETLES